MFQSQNERRAFDRRRRSLFKKGFEIQKKFQAKVYIVIERHGYLYAYRHSDRCSNWPPPVDGAEVRAAETFFPSDFQTVREAGIHGPISDTEEPESRISSSHVDTDPTHSTESDDCYGLRENSYYEAGLAMPPGPSDTTMSQYPRNNGLGGASEQFSSVFEEQKFGSSVAGTLDDQAAHFGNLWNNNERMTTLDPPEKPRLQDQQIKLEDSPPVILDEQYPEAGEPNAKRGTPRDKPPHRLVSEPESRYNSMKSRKHRVFSKAQTPDISPHKALTKGRSAYRVSPSPGSRAAAHGMGHLPRAPSRMTQKQ